MCTATYNQYFKDTLTVADQSDPIQLTVTSTGGDVFKNAVGSTTLKAMLYRAGVEIDAAGSTYTYKWYRYDSSGVLDPNFGGAGVSYKTGKTLAVGDTDVTVNAMLQKHYRNNHLEKKKFRNTGELPMFFAEETHPAIIDKDTFKAVQIVLWENKNKHENKPKPQTSEFSGHIYCPLCKKNYKHNISNGSVGWNCSTYLTKGKSHCHGKKIPETMLQTVCAEVLGIEVYNPIAFEALVDRIEVPEDNHLRFIFKDGSTAERIWEDRSRRESWTPQMKQTAAERTRQRRKNNAKNNDYPSNKK